MNAEFFGKIVDTAADKYDSAVLPPFFGELVHYESCGNSAFDCPGHQGVHPSFDRDGKTVLEAYVLKPSVSQ
jgi:ornithine decarboxylase